MKTTDYLFKTVRIKKPIFEDGYLNKGMIGRIEAIQDKEHDMFNIVFNLEEFREHNLKHEERNYWDENHRPILTATEAGFYPKNHIDSYYFMKNDDLGEYVEIIEEAIDISRQANETTREIVRMVELDIGKVLEMETVNNILVSVQNALNNFTKIKPEQL